MKAVLFFVLSWFIASFSIALFLKLGEFLVFAEGIKFYFYIFGALSFLFILNILVWVLAKLAGLWLYEN